MSDPGLLKFELVTEEPVVLVANTVYFVKNATVNRIVISGNLPQDPLRVTSTTALENIASKMYIASGNTKEEARNSIDAAAIDHTHPEASGTVPGFLSTALYTKLDAISGTNTGDETNATIKSKLGITTLSGVNTGDQTTITGNAGSATKLETARNINGVAFDGSADITINAVDSTARIAASEKGAVNGVATLGADGKVPPTQLPPLSSEGTELLTIDYENRGDLRTTVGNYAVVEGLGLFIFQAGSDEPDDDESCFATSTGRWLMEAISWDVVDSWLLPESSYTETTFENLKKDLYNLNLNLSNKKFLFGSKIGTITSVAANTQVTENITVSTASIGDHVIVTPPNALSFRFSIFGRVSFPDIVTIYINNSTTTAQSVTAGNWKVVVIKEN